MTDICRNDAPAHTVIRIANSQNKVHAGRVRERGASKGNGRIEEGCDKTTVDRLQTSHKRGEPVAITRQMFVVGEASLPALPRPHWRRLLWALKHFAPNGPQTPRYYEYKSTPPTLLPLSLSLLHRAASSPSPMADNYHALCAAARIISLEHRQIIPARVCGLVKSAKKKERKRKEGKKKKISQSSYIAR